MKKTILPAAIALSFLLCCSGYTNPIVKIQGTAAQQAKLAAHLTASLGTTVGVDAAGKLTIAAGGNASATRLRNMINDNANTVVIRTVENDPNVAHGRWNSSTNDQKGPTTDTQDVDLGDLAAIGNVINSYGITPDFFLMHEITEVYEGKKGGLNYEPAHALAIEAEKELMKEHGTELVFRQVVRAADGSIYGYAKIKRPDGSYVIVRFKLSDATLDGEWFKEATPCKFEPSKLIAIADPDPRVHLFNHNYNLLHVYAGFIDPVNSRPTGVAFDNQQNMYVAEDLLTGRDEIRVFNTAGTLLRTISHPSLVNPQGLAVDKITGEIFVAVQNSVLRFSNAGRLLGNYFVSAPFTPSGVDVWRNQHLWEIAGDGNAYFIFVTDRASGQVYRFNVNQNMNTGTADGVFGKGLLNAPEDIFIDDWWTVWVASTGNNRVYCFTPAGNAEAFGSTPFFIENPNAKITDMIKIRDEGVYVVNGNSGQGQLLLYDLKGHLVQTYGTGQMQCPAAAAFSFSTNLANLVAIPDPNEIEALSRERSLPKKIKRPYRQRTEKR